MKNRKLIPGKRYEFSWLDTYSENGWMSEEQITEKTVPLFQQSVGYLVKEDNNWYIVAMHKNKTQGFLPWALVSWIPKKSVKKIFSLPSS